MRIADVTSTDLFGGTIARPLAIVRVTLAGEGSDAAGPDAGLTVRVKGPAVTTPQPASVAWPPPGQELQAEVGVEVAAPHAAGGPVQVMVIAEDAASGGRAEGGGGTTPG